MRTHKRSLFQILSIFLGKNLIGFNSSNAWSEDKAIHWAYTWRGRENKSRGSQRQRCRAPGQECIEKQEAGRGSGLAPMQSLLISQWCPPGCLWQQWGMSISCKDTQPLTFREQQGEGNSPRCWWPGSLLMGLQGILALSIALAPPPTASTPHIPLLNSLELSSTLIITSAVHFFPAWKDGSHPLDPSHLSPFIIPSLSS